MFFLQIYLNMEILFGGIVAGMKDSSYLCIRNNEQ